MGWLDERDKEQKALEERNALIAEHAVEIYVALWDKIVEHIKEAKGKSFPTLSTNGSLQNRLVKLVINPAAPETYQFRLTLKDHLISARGGRGLDLDFSLDVCPDGVVCLKSKEEQVAIEWAAISILDQFLYPSLPRLTKPPEAWTGTTW